MADVVVRSSWPLQYATDTSRDPNSSEPPVPTLGTLDPPYAIAKSLPLITPESARRGNGGRVVVFGVINRNGQWEKLRILQTPDPDLNRVVLEALAKWMFEPAKMPPPSIAACRATASWCVRSTEAGARARRFA